MAEKIKVTAKAKYKVISDFDCPQEAVDDFNRSIAKLIISKYPKNVIEKIIEEFERKK